MTDFKISQLAQATPAAADLIPFVDVDDTSTAPAGAGGSDKAATAASILGAPQAATAVAGYTLVNGTGAIISWTAPNDGLLHRVHLFASLSVTSTETGGQITCSYTAPDGTSTSHTVYSAGQAATDVIVMGAPFSVIIKAGTTFTLSQGTALTAGASVLFAEIWGS